MRTLSCPVSFLSPGSGALFSKDRSSWSMEPHAADSLDAVEPGTEWGSHPFVRQAGMNWLISFYQLVMPHLSQPGSLCLSGDVGCALLARRPL